jgi:ABC-type spermidine/putrescine transport system permease subunit I
VKQKAHWTDRVAHGALALIAVVLLAFLAGPLLSILLQALQGRNEEFVWLDNFIAYARTPSLLDSLWNSLWVSAMVTAITVPLAFGFAYALARSCMPLKPLFRGITLIPLLAPSLLSAISLIYWFGNQGVLKGWLQALGFEQIYGAPGIVIAECFAVFPHTLMILVTALSLSDARLYEAADAMGTSAARKFFTITLPGAKYGVISAALVTFTLVITDFGIPKVIGGNFNVLATDVFKLVIGQQDFSRGAVVAILLLAPAVVTFAVDHHVSRRQTAMLTARAVPYAPRPSRAYDIGMTAYCCVIALLVLAMLGMAVFASFASFWPYNLTPSWRHYVMGLVDAEVGVGFVNSLKMAAGTAVFGTVPARAGASVGHAAHGGARPRAGPGLHLLLQRTGQSAQRPVPHGGAAHAVHHRALLHHGPPHGRDRAQEPGQRVRGRQRIAEGAVLQDLLARYPADLHAGAGGHRALLLHQRHDHDLRRRLPVLARDQGRFHRHPQPGRGRRDRRRGRHGGADRHRFHRGHAAVHAAGLVGQPAHAGLARHGALTPGEDTTHPRQRAPPWTETRFFSPPAR